MKNLSPEEVWQMADKDLSATLYHEPSELASREIRFYAPSFMYYKTSYSYSSPNAFSTISVTGNHCALNCAHCGGAVLKTMYSATTPEELIKLCKKLKLRGALGCLISGGCLPDGSVPLAGFIDAIERVKREIGLMVVVHTGLIEFETAKAVKESGVDAALIDIIGSDDTIREVCKMNATSQDYAHSLEALSAAKINFVPHVIVGLDHGRLRGELHALGMISQHKPSAVVIIAFVPIRGTRMQNVEPPEPLDIARVSLAARLMFHQTPVVLGCMRPKGNHRKQTDLLAIKAGVDAIAFPAEEAIDFATRNGYTVSFSSLCCSQVYLESENTLDHST
jgi:uncharacterized radical SAM superfamily protein